MGTVCRKLKFGDRWAVQDPVGRKGGFLIAQTDNAEVQVMSSNDFCNDLQVKIVDENEKCQVTFVHASSDSKERNGQWEELNERSKGWGIARFQGLQ